jgi:hypothetical protein
MLKMNLITQKELRGDLCWELDRELYGELYGDLWDELYEELYGEEELYHWELCEPLGSQIRTNFSHSKISRV